MNFENLLKERNVLRNQIETRRKQNEKTLLYIKGFLTKIADYVDFCEANDVRTYVWHEFDNEKYLIRCDKKEFEINLYNSCASRGIGSCFVGYSAGAVRHCVVGTNPTLETITEKNGLLTENAKWFERNIETILKLLEEDIENCIKNQIAEAKKMLE